MAVTSSNLNRFSKFFHHWKEKEISNKCTYYFPPHLKYVAALPLGIQKFKFIIKLPNKIKTRIIFVKKIKFHLYGWMDIVIITTVAQTVQHLLAHMRKDTHATRQLHCQWRCSPFRAKHYFSWFLTAWTPITNRRNYKDGKFKVCSRLFLPITVET